MDNYVSLLFLFLPTQFQQHSSTLSRFNRTKFNNNLIELDKELSLYSFNSIHYNHTENVVFNVTGYMYEYNYNITVGTRYQVHNLLAILIGLTKLLLSCCIKPLALTAFLATLKMIFAT
jgi:hypothetical protein